MKRIFGTISGYVTTTNQPTRGPRLTVKKVKSLYDQVSVGMRMWEEHDPTKLTGGRITKKRLDLQADWAGIWVEVEVDNPEVWRKLENKQLTGFSAAIKESNE